MALTGPVFLLVLIWVIIYVLRQVFKFSGIHPLLPSYSSVYRRGLWNNTVTQITLKHLHLRIQTIAWNPSHEILVTKLTAKRNSSLRIFLRRFYNVGCVMGVLGTLVGLGLLVWTVGQQGSSLIHKLVGARDASTHNSGLMRRRVEIQSVHKTVTPDVESFLKPIVPGITVPLAHLPLILAAVLLSQIIHELGHAISAALESLPILSSGLSIFIFIPSAFVTFPPIALTALAPLARLRIVAAGPFHNLVFWCILLAAGKVDWGGVLVYKDVSKDGRVVVRVETDSPLYDHLPPGSLITKLDDTNLGSSMEDVWTSFLIGPNPSHRGIGDGWCVNKALYPDSSHSCCTSQENFSNPTPMSHLSCFTQMASSTHPEPQHVCLDPIPLLTHPTHQIRCTSATDCEDTLLCVWPSLKEQLLRIAVRRESKTNEENGVEHVVLWSGPRGEIFEQVEVGTLIPRLSIFPLWLPKIVEVSFSYLKMSTLSLFLFNLLPLPLLDGAQFLQTVLDMVSSRSVNETPSEELDLESGPRPSEPNPRHRKWIRNKWCKKRWKDILGLLIPLLTTGLVLLCIAFALVNLGD